MQRQEPVVVQLDPKCLHSALKEFFDPLRSNSSRADFFTVYRRESDEFDREYTRKYDEDLNTSLIFAGLFSAVSSAFIIDVQSKLEPDPNEMTAAYMQVLIHAVNGSLFPNADPSAITWTRPPPKIVAVQCLLYASLSTSLFAAFLAMLGKQWISRYLRNRGGSAADKSRDRQRKLDGLESWHFFLVIEGLPVMLQFALLLLGCALSQYLWTISPTVAGFLIAFTLLGVAFYTFFTLAGTSSYNCPYQTPLSIFIRVSIKFIAQSNSAFARPLRTFMTSLSTIHSYCIKNLRGILIYLRSAARGAVRGFSHTAVPPQEAPEIPLAVVATPVQIWEEVRVDWDSCQADIRCIAWLLHSTTDIDVIYSTVRFAADTIWYPEIAGALSPHILSNLLFDCFVGGQVVPDMLENASAIGMALASVLSVQLNVEPENKDLKELRRHIFSKTIGISSSTPALALVITVLQSVTAITSPDLEGSVGQRVLETPHGQLSTSCKLWLSRVILQIVWGWSRDEVAPSFPVERLCKRLMGDGDQVPIILMTNCVLTMAICLGLNVDMGSLYAPNDPGALGTAIHFLDQHLRTAIMERTVRSDNIRSILPALGHFDPSLAKTIKWLCSSWMTDILDSGYTTVQRYLKAGMVVKLAWKYFQTSSRVKPAWIPPLLRYLQLSEELDSTTFFQSSPGTIALRILSYGGYSDPRMFPILTSTLVPTHPLQSRRSALAVFHGFVSNTSFPSYTEISHIDRDRFLCAVGDPFQFTPDISPQDEQHVVTDRYEPIKTALALIRFTSWDLWRGHLRRSNFTSCEEVVSTMEGRESALKYMRDVNQSWLRFLSTPGEIIAAIERLEELQCPNIAEVVFMWAWTCDVVDSVDHDAWRLIGNKTLAFYRAHGMGRLKILSQCIMDGFYHYGRVDPRCRVEGVRLPVRIRVQVRVFWYEEVVYTDHPLARVCQVRRLYRLFDCDPATLEEMVAADKVDEGVDVSLEQSLSPTHLIDCACDYP